MQFQLACDFSYFKILKIKLWLLVEKAEQAKLLVNILFIQFLVKKKKKN